jgi:hypothetical protein
MMLTAISLAISLLVAVYAVICWRAAKQKHREEWLDLYWFCGARYGAIPGVRLPRAFIPLFAPFNRGKCYAGLYFAGVRIIVLNDSGDVLLCEFEKSRCRGDIIYDVGAGGALPTATSIKQGAANELHEEVGISGDIKYMTTVTPAAGYHFIIHIFTMHVDHTVIFASTDGTYTDFKWMSKRDFAAYQDNTRDDACRILVNFFYK